MLMIITACRSVLGQSAPFTMLVAKRVRRKKIGCSHHHTYYSKTRRSRPFSWLCGFGGKIISKWEQILMFLFGGYSERAISRIMHHSYHNTRVPLTNLTFACAFLLYISSKLAKLVSWSPVTSSKSRLRSFRICSGWRQNLTANSL
jgi:hypothetical protein